MEISFVHLIKLLWDLPKLISQKQSNKLLLETAIKPMMKEIDTIHQAYLKNTCDYINQIENLKTRLDKNHPIFSKMEQDSILSSDARQRLYSLYDNTTNPKVEHFLQAVAKYFTYSDLSPFEKQPSHISQFEHLEKNKLLTTDTPTYNLLITDDRFITLFEARERLEEDYYPYKVDKSKRIIILSKEPLHKEHPHQILLVSSVVNALRHHLNSLDSNYRMVLDCYNSLTNELLK